jgi:hypothetical protein
MGCLRIEARSAQDPFGAETRFIPRTLTLHDPPGPWFPRRPLAPGAKEAVVADVRWHIGTHQVYDDLTLVVVKQQ